MSAVEQAAKAIRKVTDLWDEPLDEVHDIPQIVNALAAAGLLVTDDVSDAEVEAAASKLRAHWTGSPSLARTFPGLARAALLAARAVKLGGDHA